MVNSKELVRKQYDIVTSPNIPIETSLKHEIDLLFIHSITTANYLRCQKVIASEDKLILDIGCANGFTSLLLAEANPGAKIVGIDISEPLIAVARKRLLYHGHVDSEFHVMGVEDLLNLRLSFDYINCNDTLYLLSDPPAALQIMQSILVPHGILRANMHNTFQRERFLRSQQLFEFLGVMDDAPGTEECAVIREIMDSLQDTVLLKAQTWLNSKPEERTDEYLQMNHLMQGDKAITIPQMFEMLNAADLELIRMVDWKNWDLTTLFKNPEKIPHYFNSILSSHSDELKLYACELLNPVARLLDFWCGHLGEGTSYLPIEMWDESMWRGAEVFINPYLKLDELKTSLESSIANLIPFNISEFFSHTSTELILLTSQAAICLRMLWNEPLTIDELIKQWLSIKPLNLLTLEPVTEAEAFTEIKQTLKIMENYELIMLEVNG